MAKGYPPVLSKKTKLPKKSGYQWACELEREWEKADG